MYYGFLAAGTELSALEKIWDWAWPKLLELVKLIVIAVIIYIVGKKLIDLVQKILKKALEKGKMEPGLEHFLLSFVRCILYILLLVTIAGVIGIETSSFIAAIGSAGLAVGLALQGSLSNFAGGVLILLLKPFVVGDYIVANGQEGVVKTIDLFYTRLTTADNREIIMPNGELSNKDIVNVTVMTKRRLDLVVPVSYDTDLAAAKRVLEKLAAEQEAYLKEEPINIFVDSFGDSAINLGLRGWVLKENYWTTKWDMLEKIKYAFDENGISIPFNQLDVTIKK
ncbi:MAG: mechanosensitive ion channel family protein [Lachnospiraceae bacterium]|nr:mechanosensitive ion channel family protein [Lachnospiraceae bacterium]